MRLEISNKTDYELVFIVGDGKFGVGIMSRATVHDVQTDHISVAYNKCKGGTAKDGFDVESEYEIIGQCTVTKMLTDFSWLLEKKGQDDVEERKVVLSEYTVKAGQWGISWLKLEFNYVFPCFKPVCIYRDQPKEEVKEEEKQEDQDDEVCSTSSVGDDDGERQD